MQPDEDPSAGHAASRQDRPALASASAALCDYFATHPLAQPQLTIGRDRSCDLVIDDAVLSRRHAVLRVGPPLSVQDLGSTNGVRVNGREVMRGGEPIELAVAAMLQFGDAYPPPFWVAVLREVERLAVAWRY